MLVRLAVFAFVLSGCASAPPLVAAGSASAAPVAVDGEAADWGASLVAAAGTPLTVGVRSDGAALAVAVVTSDREAIRQILRGGLAVWLDAEGGRRRAFGVTVGGGLEADASETDAARAARFAAQPLRLAVTAGGETTTYAGGPAPGLDVAAGFDGATFVAELRVPLGGAGPFALGAAPGDVVGLGVETRAPSRNDLRERLDDRAARGSGRTPDGGRRRADRGVPSEAERSRPAPVALWLRVALADG